MFKKIVSNLSFSPTLVGQLGVYSKKLKKEQAMRKFGLIFMILVLIIQYLIIFYPPESANNSNRNDMIIGGLNTNDSDSLNNFLNDYDNNKRNLQSTLTYLGITKDEIIATKPTYFKVGNRYSWSFTPKYSYTQGERQYSINNDQGRLLTNVYARPLNLQNNPNDRIQGWVGNSSKLGWFAIMKPSGNLVTEIAPKTTSAVKCTTNNSTLWIDPTCNPNIIKSQAANNITQNTNATLVTVKANDQISYTLTVENKSQDPITIKIEDDINDILEYSNLIDNGGGYLDKNNVLSWPETTIYPKARQSRTFVINVFNQIPATAQGLSENTSYDCVLQNDFGNTLVSAIDCPVQKTIESLSSQLPKISPIKTLVASAILLIITIYFYMRSRQLNKEIKIIRHNTHTGTI